MSKKPTEQRVFADNLREAMTAAGVTQEAGLGGWVLSTVSRWYRGLNKPLDKLDRIAERWGRRRQVVRK